MPPFEPYIINGIFTDKNGNAIANATITAQNLSNGNIITTTTNSLGQFLFDCANFEKGWYNGDTIRLTGNAGATIDAEIHFSVDGGTNWMRVENDVETGLSANTVRRKVDLINYSGGMTLNITLIV